ncbi:hypothetical protein AAEZ52_23965, partial [Pseudomonas aeruginosa]
MSPTSALPALACLAVALATCEFIRRLGSARLPASRFVTIDGLRGYLAFFVFLHHSSIWYYYLKGSVAKIVKLEHAWRRLDGRNDDGFQV